MIDSTSSSHRTPHLEGFATFGANAFRRSSVRVDHLGGRTAAMLHAELLRQPEVRAGMVERARVLAADPDYPPASINEALARLILAAPDRSELEA